jgi:hypothetical protein
MGFSGGSQINQQGLFFARMEAGYRLIRFADYQASQSLEF